MRDIILPFEDVASLNRFAPDFLEITELSRKKEAVGIHEFAIPPQNEEVDAICRKEQYVFEQGYSMNLPSRIIVKVEYQEDQIDKIFVGGYGYRVEKQYYPAI